MLVYKFLPVDDLFWKAEHFMGDRSFNKLTCSEQT